MYCFVDNQISSVQRQLNLYGFKCISRGEDKGAFFHPQFKRGDWEVVKKITRYAPTKKSFGDSPLMTESASKMAEGMEAFPTHSFLKPIPMTGMAAYDPTVSQNVTSSSFHSQTNYTNYQQPAPLQSQSTQHQQYLHHPHPFSADSGSNTWWSGAPSHHVYNHLGYGGLDFQPAAHFIPAYSAPIIHHGPVASSFVPNQSSQLPLHSLSSVSASESVMSTQSSIDKPIDQLVVKEELDSAIPQVKSTEPTVKPFIHVNKDNVVLIDPYFDLDAELDMFGDASFPTAAQMMCSPTSMTDSAQIKEPKTREMGTNTDLSQANHNLVALYQLCGEFLYSNCD